MALVERSTVSELVYNHFGDCVQDGDAENFEWIVDKIYDAICSFTVDESSEEDRALVACAIREVGLMVLELAGKI